VNKPVVHASRPSIKKEENSEEEGLIEPD